MLIRIKPTYFQKFASALLLGAALVTSAVASEETKSTTSKTPKVSFVAKEKSDSDQVASQTSVIFEFEDAPGSHYISDVEKLTKKLDKKIIYDYKVLKLRLLREVQTFK